jgi:hypothetical protein
MVVMIDRTENVGIFRGPSDPFRLPNFNERIESSIHGCEAHALASLVQQAIELLRGHGATQTQE